MAWWRFFKCEAFLLESFPKRIWDMYVCVMEKEDIIVKIAFSNWFWDHFQSPIWVPQGRISSITMQCLPVGLMMRTPNWSPGRSGVLRVRWLNYRGTGSCLITSRIIFWKQPSRKGDDFFWGNIQIYTLSFSNSTSPACTFPISIVDRLLMMAYRAPDSHRQQLDMQNSQRIQVDGFFMDLGVLGTCRSKWRDESMKEWIICTYIYILIYIYIKAIHYMIY